MLLCSTVGPFLAALKHLHVLISDSSTFLPDMREGSTFRPLSRKRKINKPEADGL